MHLVLNHVAEFQHVGHTHRSLLLECLTRTTVVQSGLAVTGKPCFVARTKIIDGKDLFVSVDNNINNDIAYSDDSDNRSNEACVNLGLTFAVGQHCEKLRVKYVDAIKSRLLGMDPKARMVYAEEILHLLLK